MKKFIVSQDRKMIVEVKGSVSISRDSYGLDSHKIVCSGYTVANNLTEQEALNQISLISAFLNTKGTINEGVYYIPKFKA